MSKLKVGDFPKFKFVDFREWEAKTVYKVLVSFHPEQPLHEALMHVDSNGFGEPSGAIWQGGDYLPVDSSFAYHLKYKRKLCKVS